MTIIFTARRCNAAGVAIIKKSESCKLKAYECPSSLARRKAGLPPFWTIGWGHTGPDVYEGMTITQARADELFAADLAKFEAGVARLVKAPISENAFSALVSFSYNCGLDEDLDDKAEGLGDSTLLKLVNSGKLAAAAEEFKKWNKVSGIVTGGLVTRRAAERALFLLPDQPRL